MNTMETFNRPGLLERLTSSTVFTVLLGVASIVVAPYLLLGVVMLSGSILGDAHAGVGGRLLALLPYGGLIGYIGLFRARRPPTSTVDYRATLICLGVGIATAAAVSGGLIAMSFRVDLERAGSLVALSLPIVAALGRIARLRRWRAETEGRVLDSLPLIFLTVALAETACAIAIGVQLASVG
jgi:hypothetical protein